MGCSMLSPKYLFTVGVGVIAFLWGLLFGLLGLRLPVQLQTTRRPLRIHQGMSIDLRIQQMVVSSHLYPQLLPFTVNLLFLSVYLSCVVLPDPAMQICRLRISVAFCGLEQPVMVHVLELRGIQSDDLQATRDRFTAWRFVQWRSSLDPGHHLRARSLDGPNKTTAPPDFTHPPVHFLSHAHAPFLSATPSIYGCSPDRHGLPAI